MLSDIEISQNASIQSIIKIAAKLGIPEDYLECYGRYKAKISPSFWNKIKNNKDGKLILVTAINPTPAGEGKTTTTIGLGEALELCGHKACIALREPSLGPCFGVKGGATGGGYSQVVPMEDINLHFTGDLHAITSAHNLLAAVIDNHIYHGNELDFDLKHITWKRVLDLNDRALRQVTIGLGKKTDGVPRDTGFDITVASEIMAIICLAENMADLKRRLDRIIVGYNTKGEKITCGMLKVTGALAVLLKDAIKPNLVQTIHGTPAFVHGGPFANIAHGCNSIIATKHALKLADYVVTEAGFGADLGAEKFLDIKCPLLGKYPDAVVIVATVKALKMHGGVAKDKLNEENMSALALGFENLEKHIESVQRYNLPVIVALNIFAHDTENELNFIKGKCNELGVQAELSDVWKSGGQGGITLAKAVVKATETSSTFRPLYKWQDSIVSKVETIAKIIYGAKGVIFEQKARESLALLETEEYPVCIAKVPNSLSDNKALLGRPKDFNITIRDIKLMNGAGFVVAYAGDIMTMPGLPTHPKAEEIDIADDRKITGLE